MINALKYAFPTPAPNAQVVVTYASGADGWRLTVADNGVGKAVSASLPATGGLGSVIVDALVRQLGASIQLADARPGHSVSIARIDLAA